MSLYDFIDKRKSTRKYDMAPIDEATLDRIKQFARELKPLIPDIKVECEIVHSSKGLFAVKSPYYYMIYSENKEGYLENAGFMFQQMDLFLSSLSLGSCWFGGAKAPAAPGSALPFVIALAFGKAEGSPHRGTNDFKRKPLSQISNGSGQILEAARLAPSSVNSQSWFFECEDADAIDVYQKKAMIGIYENMRKIDIGIALCHMSLAAEHLGKGFAFSKASGKDKQGYSYIGTVTE